MTLRWLLVFQVWLYARRHLCTVYKQEQHTAALLGERMLCL